MTGGLETGSPGRGAPLGIPGARAAPPPRPAPPRRPFPPGALSSLPAGSVPGLRPRRHVTEQARPAGHAGRRRGRAGWAPSVESRQRRRQEPAAFSGRPVAGARRLSLSGDSRVSSPGFHYAGLEFRVCGWTRSRTRGDGARYCAPGLGTRRRDPVTMGTDGLSVPGLEPGESQRFQHSDQARPLGGPSAGGVARLAGPFGCTPPFFAVPAPLLPPPEVGLSLACLWGRGSWRCPGTARAGETVAALWPSGLPLSSVMGGPSRPPR